MLLIRVASTVLDEKRRTYVSLQLEELPSIPLRKNKTLKSASAASGIPMTTLLSRMKASTKLLIYC